MVSQLFWERDSRTGYIYTVGSDGLPSEQFFIVPGIMSNLNTLYSYALPGKPLLNGSMADCKALASSK